MCVHGLCSWFWAKAHLRGSALLVLMCTLCISDTVCHFDDNTDRQDLRYLKHVVFEIILILKERDKVTTGDGTIIAYLYTLFSCEYV